MHQERQWYPIQHLCRVLRVSRAGYYAWVKTGGHTRREHADVLLLGDIRRVFAEHQGRYGSTRVYKQLCKETVRCSKARVERLMREANIRAKHKRKFKATTDSAHQRPVAPNVLAGQFTQKHANQAWVGDITYVPTEEGWLYLAVLIDLFSRRIVGWAMDKRMTCELPLRALHMAVQNRRPPRGLIQHTDRGSQYASRVYQQALQQYGMICSMSGKGHCYDNAVAESFFHTLKVEMVHDEKFATREHAQTAIFKYMEVYYNGRRMHSALDYQSPIEYEREALLKIA